MKVISSHTHSFDSAPRVREGDTVVFGRFDPRNPAWFFGRDACGTEGFFPAGWFRISESDGTATACRIYDGMELSVNVGDSIAVEEEYGGWALVASGDRRGWIPRSCLPLEDPVAPPN